MANGLDNAVLKAVSFLIFFLQINVDLTTTTSFFLQQTIDEVENLIKKHEAFEKAAAAQEERFAALERLTTVSPDISCFICFNPDGSSALC